MNWVFAVFLVLHVGGAIFAFGPTLTFPLIGSMGGKEPMHVNFAVRVAERIEERLIVPLAILQAITGIVIIWTLPVNILDGAHWWLILGIALYVIALIIVFMNQIPVTRQLVEATNTPPPAPAPGAPPPSGPPPHIAALVRRNQMGGMILTVLLFVIIILMVAGAKGFLF
ncbi:MAG TPA: DUF2269 family protein [Candidatus Limnocylindrales bacterium]